MSGIRRRDGRPVWIANGGEAHVLARQDLQSAAGTHYDENWLQQILHSHPAILPVEQIEPGFGHLIPLCRELPLSLGGGQFGYLDNLFVTADGGLFLIEAKLWRNPEARRKVVAQALEYVAAVFRLGYGELEQAVLRARGKAERSATSLTEIVGWTAPDLDEAEFVDAVSRNLKRGRAIVAVVGDGIREDILPLAELLQSHAGHRFTFALVELGVFEAPINGVRLIVPSVLAQTVLIERGVIRFDGQTDHLTVSAATVQHTSDLTQSSRRVGSIGEDEFFDMLARKNSEWPDLLRYFLDEAVKIGFYAERKGGLNLKHPYPEGQPLNLASINKEGAVETAPATWWNRQFGLPYAERIAGLIDGSVKATVGGKEHSVRTTAGRMPTLSDLLPDHEKEWLEAAREYISDEFIHVNAEP